jgi:hypothetical protein
MGQSQRASGDSSEGWFCAAPNRLRFGGRLGFTVEDFGVTALGPKCLCRKLEEAATKDSVQLTPISIPEVRAALESLFPVFNEGREQSNR